MEKSGWKLLGRCTSERLAASRPLHTSPPEGKLLLRTQLVRGQRKLQRQSYSEDKTARCRAGCQAGLTLSVLEELQGTEDSHTPGSIRNRPGNQRASGSRKRVDGLL